MYISGVKSESIKIVTPSLFSDTARLLESGSQSDESDMEGYANEAATGPAVQAGSDEADTSDREVAAAADSYTVDEAVETLGFGWFQVRIIAIGGVLTVRKARGGLGRNRERTL